MAINLPIAENINPYDSASLIRGGGVTGPLVDQPVAPVSSPAPSPQQTSTPANTSTRPVSTAAPAPATTPEPTIGQTLAGIKTEALRVQDELNRRNASKGSVTGLTYDTGPTYEQLYPTINERDIQRKQMRLFQKEIDATNRVYNDMLGQERLAGQGRLGSQTAMAARGGLLGSDFGEAQRQNQVGFNQQSERAIENERLAKIGSIMGTMRKAVADEIANKRLARQQDAQSYISYLASAKERRTANLALAATSLLDAGLDPLTMDPAELDAIGKEANLSANDIITQYRQLKKSTEAAAAESGLKTRKTEAEIKKIEADIAKGKLIELGEGTMLYNIETGETFKNPKTYAPKTGSGSAALGLTPDDKRNLLGGGWSEGDIDAIENDVRTFGLTEAIQNAKNNGASASQIAAMQKAYGAEGNTQQFLTKDYFKGLFTEDQLKQSAKDAGFISGGDDFIPFNESADTEAYLSNIENIINSYRTAGYTDQEILKMMQ
jgi:DnaJ-domain-containing protein 1